MDTTLLLVATAALSAICQVIIMVSLYHFWIIPAILRGVKSDLGVAVNGWIDSATVKISELVGVNISEQIEKFRASIMGRRGNLARQEQLAERFLTANLPEDADLEEPDLNVSGVINEAITRYGAGVVRALLQQKQQPENIKSEKPDW